MLQNGSKLQNVEQEEEKKMPPHIRSTENSSVVELTDWKTGYFPT
jgi:hypothetical protein